MVSDYDKVRRVEQRTDKDKSERQMVERALNFLRALKEPTARIGAKRAQRKTPKKGADFTPTSQSQSIGRFDQLNKADRWSKTVYGEGDFGNGHAKISVQDPRDPEDIEIGPITPTPPRADRVTGEEERELNKEKVSNLVVEDVEV